jgi:hypothetical protein
VIIGLTGVAGSGKTTIANILVRKHGFTRRPFAYPLKSMIASLGFSRDVLDGPAPGKEVPLDVFGGKTLRHAMQTLGTEWGRAQFGDDFWINMWAQTGKDVPGDIVVDDVRFPNEAKAIQDRGGLVWKLIRAGAGGKTGANHASEAVHQIDEDVTFFNHDTDFDDLERRIEAMLDCAPA